MKKIAVILLLGLIAGSAFTQSMKKNINNRRYEPVVISMSRFGDFLLKGLKLSDFYFYAFDSDSSTWRPVPFQIDDRQKTDKGIKYVFDAPPDTLDKYDELVFLMRDLGDKVPDGYWIDNDEAKQQYRYEIEIEDTSAIADSLEGEQKAWGYLFYSGSITDYVTNDYLDYSNDVDKLNISDEVVSDYYSISFYSVNGLPIHLNVTELNGGNNERMLDRLKIRVKVDDIKIVGVSGAIAPAIVNEMNIERNLIKVIDSKVRVIRDMKVKIKVDIKLAIWPYSTVYTYEDTSHFPIYFYPYNFKIESDNISLDTDNIDDVELKIKLIRTSMDLRETLIQTYGTMAFYDKFNKLPPQQSANQNLIDGLGGSNIRKGPLDAPNLYWFLVTGNSGSYFQTTTVPAIGDDQLVYYWDYKNSSLTLDGTPDTGETGAWGDSGIWIRGNDIQGEFKLLSETYMLPANQVAEVGDTLNANIESPAKINLQQQLFDIYPPGTITNLNAVPESDSTVLLVWTAPGDDGDSGQASKYDIRFSTQAPDPGQEEIWFDTIADTVSGEPKPSIAGTEENFTVSGLEAYQTYYFAIKTSDESQTNDGKGNSSSVSNVASGTALEVELVNFSAQTTFEEVTLTWETANEDNNLGFEIQRRKENGNYEAISFVPGNGTTSEPNNYSFTDKNVSAGVYYYRLKQIDFNGAFTIYEEIKVALGVPTQFALYQNYPNPFNPSTTLQYDLAKAGQVTLVVYNTKGQVMKTLINGFQDVGRYKKKLNAANWPSGIYFARLTAGSNTFVKKMILLE